MPLFLPFAGVPDSAIDSPSTLELKHHGAKIRAEIPLLIGGAPLRTLNHGCAAGASIAMPRVRSIG